MNTETKDSKKAIDPKSVLWNIISIYWIFWVAFCPLIICMLPVLPYLITENGNWLFLMILSVPIGFAVGYKMWNIDYIGRYYITTEEQGIKPDENCPLPPVPEDIELRKAQLESLNKERKSHGYPPLKLEDILYKRAKCFVKTEDGRHYVFMPNGDKIPMQSKTIIIDSTEKGHAKAHITLYVDLL